MGIAMDIIMGTIMGTIMVIGQGMQEENMIQEMRTIEHEKGGNEPGLALGAKRERMGDLM